MAEDRRKGFHLDVLENWFKKSAAPREVESQRDNGLVMFQPSVLKENHWRVELLLRISTSCSIQETKKVDLWHGFTMALYYNTKI